jgi:hypothetical protein
MNRKLEELLLQRGRLQERITTQRYFLQREIMPVHDALASVDRVIARINAVGQYLKKHPALVALGVAALLVMRTRRVLQWAKRGFFVWQSWRALRDRLAMFSARVRS